MSNNSEILGYLNNISNMINIENQDLLQLKEDRSKLLKKINDINQNSILLNDNTPSVITSIVDTSNNNTSINNISNKEALKSKIHEIHNYLRNNGAGYGMNALKVFNVIYGLKKIEESKLLDKVNLKRPDCEFSHLLKLANENKGELLAELIIGSVLTSISESELKYILFYEIPQNMKGSAFIYLIKEIENITIIEKTCNVLLSGKIYEYFIGRDESAISELGAYFTDRHIVDYILKKLNPELNPDGTIGTMIDMFGGSGGFTTGYINYLNAQSKNQQQIINWTTEINKISHFDMNEDVIKSAGLEFFCLTGELPNKDNLQYKNSFKDEFCDHKYKYPLTNPPYGGDKIKKTNSQIKRDKVKEYIKNELITITDSTVRINRQKQLKELEAQEKQEKIESDKTTVSVSTCSARIKKFAHDNKLSGNDKESCSLMLLMDIVEFGGTAIGVLKEGVFFNRTYTDLRKHLIKNYNLREVISVPQDQFENTQTKTSVIIFDNIEEKTTEVKFSEIVVERCLEDKFVELLNDIVIVESKGDITGVNDAIVSVASKEELLKNPICSFNGKDYNKKVLIVGEGYELIKLGDICEFMKKSKRNASFGQHTGQYNFYTSSDKVQKCDIDDYKEECLIIGSGGVANIKLDNNFSCSADNMLLKTKYNKYIYYILKGNMQMLAYGFKGSTLKHLSKDYLKYLQIPIPQSQDKIKEWVDKISASYNEKNEKQTQIKELETFVRNRIKDISEKEKDIVLKTLGEVSKINYGKRITKIKDEGSEYLAYGGGDLMAYKVNKYNRDGITYKVSRDGLSKHNCIIKLYGKLFLNDTALTLDTLDNKIVTNNYIGEFLLSQKNYIYDNCTHGTAQLHINIDKLMKIKIPIPSFEIQLDLETTFQQIETLQNDVRSAESLYKQYIKELAQEAMPHYESQ
jgi:restriction endonuclease S subunit/type I restriction-modification system DNA methylase subunit